MDELNLSRQVAIIDPRLLATPVKVIGVGGIGSALAFILAKMGCSDIEIWDHDKVEDHNVPNQVHRPSDIGAFKTDAMYSVISEFSGTSVTAHAERWKGHPLSGIVFVCVDSMRARRAVWKAVKYNAKISLLVEGRMGGLVGYVYFVRPYDLDDIVFYRKTLYSDRRAENVPCTERAIVFNTFGIASMMAAGMVRHLNGGRPPIELSLDFFNFTFIGNSY